MNIAVIKAMAPLVCNRFGGRNARTVSFISVGNVNTKKAKRRQKKKGRLHLLLNRLIKLTSCTTK